MLILNEGVVELAQHGVVNAKYHAEPWVERIERDSSQPRIDRLFVPSHHIQVVRHVVPGVRVVRVSRTACRNARSPLGQSHS